MRTHNNLGKPRLPKNFKQRHKLNAQSFSPNSTFDAPQMWFSTVMADVCCVLLSGHRFPKCCALLSTSALGKLRRSVVILGQCRLRAVHVDRHQGRKPDVRCGFASMSAVRDNTRSERQFAGRFMQQYTGAPSRPTPLCLRFGRVCSPVPGARLCNTGEFFLSIHHQGHARNHFDVVPCQADIA